MKKTNKHPILVTIAYPDGQRLEARIPLWKAYVILADLERVKMLKEAKESRHSIS